VEFVLLVTLRQQDANIKNINGIFLTMAVSTDPKQNINPKLDFAFFITKRTQPYLKFISMGQF
jgi:hypothetical protein